MTTTYTLTMNSQDPDGLSNSSANITTDNPDELMRLLNLAGVPDQTVADAQPVDAVVDVVPQPTVDYSVVPSNISCDMSDELATTPYQSPYTSYTPDHANNPQTPCEYCDACGNPMEMCCCSDKYSPELDEESQDPDPDYSSVTDRFENQEVDQDNYMWRGPKEPQRLAKLGDNNLAEALYSKFKKQWNDYLLEEFENESGQASPLTSSLQDEFDKDPSSDDEMHFDGTYSPMTNIKRQKLTK